MLHIRISEDEKNLIKKICERECRGISSMIRYLIQQTAKSYDFPPEEENILLSNEMDKRYESPE